MTENSDNNMSGDTITNSNGGHDVPLVFLRERDLFGNRKPSSNEWLKHEEMYRAISRKIDPSHICGLQRVGTMWRIYVDSLEDKVVLMADGVPLRNKNVPVLPTNPGRLDSESTTLVRVKNIPLSADDGIITRKLTLSGAEVIRVIREKLRIDGKLTNCCTGDRLLICKSSSLREPLPTFMEFGHFKGRVLHSGQQSVTGTRSEPICSKCTQKGHKFSDCPNDWVCNNCKKSGHKQSDCPVVDISESDDRSDSESDSDADPPTPIAQPVKASSSCVSDTSLPNTPSTRKASTGRGSQPPIDLFINMGNSENNTETPNKGKTGHAQERSPPTPVDVLHNRSQTNNGKKSKNKK